MTSPSYSPRFAGALGAAARWGRATFIPFYGVRCMGRNMLRESKGTNYNRNRVRIPTAPFINNACPGLVSGYTPMD